ncbi:MAG: hypothetical protein PVI23_07180, partial [Maricaulaceae bacterium]
MSSSSDDTHFEVFEKANRKASWRLVEARDTKASALELAAERIKKTPGASIRVTKEKWIADDGAFRSYTIFEAGEKFEEDDRADRTAEIPCRTPGDLAKAMARETIGRVLGDWLSRNKATPLELLHRVDLVEKLEASGTEYQHAIQKVAIARASSADANVQNIIKQLNALLQRTIEQLYESHRAEAFVAVKPGRFADAVDAATGEGAQKLRGAIALHLKDADRWTAKLDAILTLAEETRGMDKAQRALAVNVLGEYAVDIIEIEAARIALLDGDCDTGDALD